jgi:hypothetical protein
MKDYKWNEEFTSQKAGVRAWLLDGKTITPIEALNNFGSLRLSAIIFRLREEGLPIEMERLQVSPKKRVAKYYIKPENLNK